MENMKSGGLAGCDIKERPKVLTSGLIPNRTAISDGIHPRIPQQTTKATLHP
jgi:hypothetical protein